MWCIVWASGNQEEVQPCLVTLWLFIISCYSLSKTILGLLCSWKLAWSLNKASTFNALETLCENVYLCGFPNLLVITQIHITIMSRVWIQTRRICICISSNFKPCICIRIWSTIFSVFDKYVFKYTLFLCRFPNTSLWNTNLHEYSL